MKLVTIDSPPSGRIGALLASGEILDIARARKPGTIEAWIPLSVREVRASVGAGFVYPICGEMRTMPGLGKAPAAAIIDLLENGDIINLS